MRNLSLLRHFDEVSLPMMLGGWQSLANSHRGFSPCCDMREEDTHYSLSFDLPGVSKDDIQIEIENSQIRVSGERKSENSEKGHIEKRYGCFERTISLPQEVDEEGVKAHYRDGVLKVELPKAAKALPRKISISA